VIIDLPPPIQRLLQMRGIAPLGLAQDFSRQPPMKAFIFPHRLRMIRTTVTDAKAHVQQPDGQDGIRLFAGMTPGTLHTRLTPLTTRDSI